MPPVPIASPCIRICTIHPHTGLCEGCHRTLKEIAGWSRLSQEERERIMSELPERARSREGDGGGPVG